MDAVDVDVIVTAAHSIASRRATGLTLHWLRYVNRKIVRSPAHSVHINVKTVQLIKVATIED